VTGANEPYTGFGTPIGLGSLERRKINPGLGARYQVSIDSVEKAFMREKINALA
jgi:hypothetical protein